MTQIVVIFLVPFFTFFSMLVAVFAAFEDFEEILITLRATYEAILVVGFFHLILAYLSEKARVSKFC